MRFSFIFVLLVALSSIFIGEASAAIDCDVTGEKRQKFLRDYSSLYTGEDKPLWRCPAYDDIDPGFLNATLNGVRFRIRRHSVMYPGVYEADGPVGEIRVTPTVLNDPWVQWGIRMIYFDGITFFSLQQPKFCIEGFCLIRAEARMINIISYLVNDSENVIYKDPDIDQVKLYQKIIENSQNMDIRRPEEAYLTGSKIYEKKDVSIIRLKKNNKLSRLIACNKQKKECYWAAQHEGRYWALLGISEIGIQRVLELIPKIEDHVLSRLIVR